MKRFTKMLAMGMAMALTFGMTVSAAEDGTPTDPSPSTKLVISAEGDVTTSMAQGDVEGASEKAIHENGALDAFGHRIDYDVVDTFYLAVGKDGGTVKFEEVARGIMLDRPEDYGYGWGYALFCFDKGLDKAPQVIKMAKDSNDSYSAKVTKSANYALVAWRLGYDVIDGNQNVVGTHGLSVDKNKGVVRNTYQDEHTAARIAIENDNYGNIVAQYYNAQYVFAKTMGSVVMNLEKDSKVQFNNLDNLEQGEAYIVLCYNDVRNISGAPNRHFLMTDKVADKTYTVDLPKGEYAAVVIKVTTDATKVVTTPVAAPEAGTVAPGINAGSQATGVVSPKTGEMLPVAVILAAICLAGAAVCAKKALTNA